MMMLASVLHGQLQTTRWNAIGDFVILTTKALTLADFVCISRFSLKIFLRRYILQTRSFSVEGRENFLLLRASVDEISVILQNF